MAEWTKATLLKSVGGRDVLRGFESYRFLHGTVAQLEERQREALNVVGSIPARTTMNTNQLRSLQSLATGLQRLKQQYGELLEQIKMAGFDLQIAVYPDLPKTWTFVSMSSTAHWWKWAKGR